MGVLFRLIGMLLGCDYRLKSQCDSIYCLPDILLPLCSPCFVWLVRVKGCGQPPWIFSTQKRQDILGQAGVSRLLEKFSCTEQLLTIIIIILNATSIAKQKQTKVDCDASIR